MDVDFSHPLNLEILRYLRNPFDFIVGPKASFFREARERDPAGGRVFSSQSPERINWLNLGTHPDLVERLWRQVAASLPEPCQWVVYGSPALVHPRTGVVFGWAGGTHTHGLRIPAPERPIPAFQNKNGFYIRASAFIGISLRLPYPSRSSGRERSISKLGREGRQNCSGPSAACRK